MIEQKLEGNQLPNEIKPVFDELQVLQHLKQAGIKKKASSLYWMADSLNHRKIVNTAHEYFNKSPLPNVG